MVETVSKEFWYSFFVAQINTDYNLKMINRYLPKDNCTKALLKFQPIQISLKKIQWVNIHYNFFTKESEARMKYNFSYIIS
jgi:hypothetical protein